MIIPLAYWHIYSPTFKFTSLVFINFYIPFLPSWWISKIFSNNPFLCTQMLGYWFLNMNNWCAGRSPSREWSASVLFSSLSWIIKYTAQKMMYQCFVCSDIDFSSKTCTPTFNQKSLLFLSIDIAFICQWHFYMKYTGSSMGSHFTELTRDDYNVFLQYYGPQEFRLYKWND